jgi:dTMP kinase
MAHFLPHGVLIAFEGIDGSGKSTQANLLGDWAEREGLALTRTREPTRGPWGQKIRDARFSQRMSVVDETAAFMADRRDHVKTLIQPALARGELVIVDRYYYSTGAYQGARGLNPHQLLTENRAFAPKPSLVCLIDVEPDVSSSRIASRGEGQDLFENAEYLKQVRALFLEMVEPHIVVIDGARPAHVVFQEVLTHITKGPLASWVKP